MKDIRQLHRDAMALMKKASDALSQGDTQSHKEFSEKAYALERESAYELIDKLDSEPTRGVLFRSAAYLAYNIEYFEEAKGLIELGLSGNPFPEIKAELNELLEKVNTEIVKKNIQDQKNENAANETLDQSGYKDIDHDTLIAGLNEKSPEAIKYLFDIFYTNLVVFAYRMIENEEEAEDISIAAFTKLVSRSIKFSSIEQLKAYLYISIRNSCLNYLKSINRMKEVENLKITSEKEEALNFESMNIEIINLSEELPKQIAAIIKLTMQNLNPNEIAKELNISVNQVFYIGNKGTEMLQEKMLRFK